MAASYSRRDIMAAAGKAALATPFLSLLGGSAMAAGDEVLIYGATMGTTYSVRIPRLPKAVAVDALKIHIDRLLETVNEQMSTYRPQSELSRFNTGDGQAWVPVSPDVATVARAALAISQVSSGAYDPTIGPLVSLWGFGAGGGSQGVPDAGQLEARRHGIGHHHLRFRSKAQALLKTRHGLQVDLSGIAKGFAVDKVCEHFEQLGIESYLFEIGGEVRVRGYGRRGDFWRIGIEQPGGAGVRRTIRLVGGAVATSGDYRHFFESRGRRYSHILDPRNGRPVAHDLSSVTVIAPAAMQADAWSTALMVLGPVYGLALAKQQDIAAYFLARAGGRLREIASPAFLPYIGG
jgi:FAD:protein FMN transferase